MSKNQTFLELKKNCLHANLQLPKLGLVMYTFGNVSVLHTGGKMFAIKPSGVDYDQMKAGDMVIVDFSNKKIEGKRNPSSDTKTHAALYRGFPGIGSVVHTHSPYATSWAQASRDVIIYGTTHADHVAGDIPCTELMDDERITGDYEEETGAQIIRTFRKRGLDPLIVEMVLVAGHGAFTWGKTSEKAVYNAKVLEELCRMAMYTERINPGAVRLKETLIRKHFERKHGKNAYYGQS